MPNPTSSSPSRWRQVLLAGLMALVAWHLLCVLAVVALRIGYPFELEWMEGGALVEVRRVLAGQPLYAAPSIAYVPYIYAPLYFYVSALPAALLGPSLLPLRLTSFASTVIAAWLLGRLTARETGSALAGWAAVGTFAATFVLSATWFDIARVDNLALALLLGAVYGLRFSERHAGLAIAGLCAGLACLTKQQCLAVTAGLSVLAVYWAGRRAWAFVGPAVVVPLVGYAAVFRWGGEWARTFLFELPSRHYFTKRIAWTLLSHDWVWPLGLATCLGLWALVTRWRRGERRTVVFDAGVLAILGATSIASRLNVGATSNVMLPLYAWLAVLVGLAVHAASAIPRRGAIVPALAIVQLAVLLYAPMRFVPTAADREAGERLVERIRATPGEVWVSAHPDLAERAGKRAYAHEMAIMEVLLADLDRRWDFYASLDSAMRERRFSALVLDQPRPVPGHSASMLDNYVAEPGPVVPGDAFYPVAGHATRPSIWMVPRPPAR